MVVSDQINPVRHRLADAIIAGAHDGNTGIAEEVGRHRFFHSDWLKRIVCALIGSAVIGLVTLYVACGQSLDRQLDLRAYASAESASVTAVDSRGPSQVVVVVENSGKTPSHEMVVEMDAWSDESDDPTATPFDATRHAESATSLTQGKTFSVPCIVGEPSRRELNPRNAVIHLRGKVNYKDEFGVSHASNFYFTWDGSRRTSRLMRRAMLPGSDDWASY